MTLEDAKEHVGKLVMSVDAGSKMVDETPIPHGPYRLKQITKSGRCILEGYDLRDIYSRHLREFPQ